MSARGRPWCLHLHHGLRPAVQQRRLLNHFISKTSEPTEPTDSSSPPHHFTLAVKDNIATTASSFASYPSSYPTTCASPFLATYHSPFEATIVTQLRARGARLVGKTNLDEFGMGSHSTHSAFGAVAQVHDPHPPRPQAPHHTPEPAPSEQLKSAGGSSGGSAVAVSLGAADVALGTDTGGSVRLPAAYCGVVGFKPSYGMLSRFGVVPYANSLDTVGLFAKRVGDIRGLVVGSSAGTQRAGAVGERGQEGEGGLWREADARDPTSLTGPARERCASGREGYGGDLGENKGLRGLRFGIPLEYNIDELDPRIRDAWAATAKRLQDEFGARAVPVSLPSTRHALSAYYVIAPAEASSNLAKYDGIRYGTRDNTGSDSSSDGVLYAATRGRGFGDEVKRRILLGSYTLSSAAMDNYFLQAQRVRRLVRRDFNRVFALDNPLHERETFDLTDLDESIAMEDKWGPEEVDFLLCPTAPTLAPLLADVLNQTPVDAYMNDVFTVPASLAGLPAISLPMPLRSGKPAEDGTQRESAGLQIIGQYWDDARLLAVAEAVSEMLQAR